MKQYYAFEYFNGPHCTTGDYPNTRIAGSGHVFTEKKARDNFVKDGPAIGSPNERISLTREDARKKKYGCLAKRGL